MDPALFSHIWNLDNLPGVILVGVVLLARGVYLWARKKWPGKF